MQIKYADVLNALRHLNRPHSHDWGNWSGHPDVSQLFKRENLLLDQAVRKVLTSALEVLRHENSEFFLVLHARFWQARSVAETSELINKSESSVFSHQRQAINRLTQLLNSTPRIEVHKAVAPALPRSRTSTSVVTQGSAPPTPPLFLGREADMKALRSRMGATVDGDANPSDLISIVLRGWPGVGKSTILSALAHDQLVRRAFPDGVLWTALGQQPSIFSLLAAWGRALGRPDSWHAESIEELTALIAAALSGQRRLIIVDDVWDPDHYKPFAVGGAGCASLTATRLPKVAIALSSRADDIYALGVLSDDASMELLEALAPEAVATSPDECRDLIRELEGLPLAIQVAGRLLQSEVTYGFGITELLSDVRNRARMLAARAPVSHMETSGNTLTVKALLQKSTDLLDKHTLDCFASLGVFAPKPATFNQEAMQAVWETNDPQTIIRRLVDRGLLEPVGQQRFWMHALLVDHARTLL